MAGLVLPRYVAPPLAPGNQRLALVQKHRWATCEEARCRRFLYGEEGVYDAADGKGPEHYRHEAGVPCTKCPDPACPCLLFARYRQGPTWAEREPWSRVYPHRLPDEQKGLKYARRIANNPDGVREIVESEYVDRLHEGTDTIARIIKGQLEPDWP